MTVATPNLTNRTLKEAFIGQSKKPFIWLVKTRACLVFLINMRFTCPNPHQAVSVSPSTASREPTLVHICTAFDSTKHLFEKGDGSTAHPPPSPIAMPYYSVLTTLCQCDPEPSTRTRTYPALTLTLRFSQPYIGYCCCPSNPPVT